jgi:hypothetical protein
VVRVAKGRLWDLSEGSGDQGSFQVASVAKRRFQGIGFVRLPAEIATGFEFVGFRGSGTGLELASVW